jgi:hypothetical protein
MEALRMKWLGFILIFVSCYSFEQGQYSAKLVLMFLLGLLMVCGKPLIEHLFFVEREKVRSQYRYRNKR